MVEIDIDVAIGHGSGFVPHKNVLESIQREGLKSKSRDLANAIAAAEVHFKDKIPLEAILRRFGME